MLNGVERKSLKSEADGQPETIVMTDKSERNGSSGAPEAAKDGSDGQKKDQPTKLSEVDAKGDQATVPSPVVAAPDLAEIGPKIKGKLPDVAVASDQALVPIVGLASPYPRSTAKAGENKSYYTFTRKSAAGSYGMKCAVMEWVDLKTAPNAILCSLETASGMVIAVQPQDLSWTVVLTQCPTAKILENAIGNGCEGLDADNCTSYTPAARVSFGEVNIGKCIANGSQVIFTVKDPARDTSSTLTLTLAKVDASGMLIK